MRRTPPVHIVLWSLPALIVAAWLTVDRWTDAREAPAVRAELRDLRLIKRTSSGSVYRATWVLQNDLEADARVIETTPTCVCMNVVEAPPVLHPGSTQIVECDVEVIGGKKFTGQAMLRHEGGRCVLPPVTVYGEVEGALFLEPSAFELGSLEPGSRRRIEVSLAVVGTSALAEAQLDLSVSPPDIAAVVSKRFDGPAREFGPMMRRTGRCVLELRPSNARRIVRGHVSLTANMGEVSSRGRVLLLWTVPAEYRTSPASVFIGSVAAGAVIERTLQVRREDGKPFAVVEAALEDPTAGTVRIERGSNVSSGTIHLSFTAPQRAGAFSTRAVCVLESGAPARRRNLAVRIAGVVEANTGIAGSEPGE